MTQMLEDLGKAYYEATAEYDSYKRPAGLSSADAIKFDIEERRLLWASVAAKIAYERALDAMNHARAS